MSAESQAATPGGSIRSAMKHHGISTHDVGSGFKADIRSHAHPTKIAEHLQKQGWTRKWSMKHNGQVTHQMHHPDYGNHVISGEHMAGIHHGQKSHNTSIEHTNYSTAEEFSAMNNLLQEMGETFAARPGGPLRMRHEEVDTSDLGRNGSTVTSHGDYSLHQIPGSAAHKVTYKAKAKSSPSVTTQHNSRAEAFRHVLNHHKAIVEKASYFSANVK